MEHLDVLENSLTYDRMVTIDIKQLLREERQRRKTPQADVPQRAEDEAAECSLTDQIDLGDYAVGQDKLQGLYYVPNALTRQRENAILAAIDSAPASRWVPAEGRRVLNFGGRPGTAAVTEALPGFLSSSLDGFQAAGLFTEAERPNHCLVNSYERSAPCPVHQDGPLYLDKVVTVTLGGPALIAFRRSLPDGSARPDVVTEVLLQPRCCFVVSGPAYSQHQHGIEGRDTDNITELCCNAVAAGVAVGQRVPRAERRVSLVFVRKLSPAEQAQHAQRQA